jgi:hypothetical protein
MKLADDVPESIQCAPQSADLQGLLDRRASYAGARKTFDAQCALEGKLRDQLDNIAERVRTKELQPPLALTEAKKIVDGCHRPGGHRWRPWRAIVGVLQSGE